MAIQFTPLHWVDTNDPQTPATPADPYLNAATLNLREQKLAELVAQINALTADAGATELALATKADLVGGKVAVAQLPALSITDVFPVPDESAMLALTAQRGDLAVRADTGSTWALAAEPASTLGNWVQLPAIGHVASVNGQVGAVQTRLAEQADVDTTDIAAGARGILIPDETGAFTLTALPPPAGRVWNSGPLVPDPAVDTDGAPAACTPSPGFAGLAAVTAARAVVAGTLAAEETVTVTLTATFGDDTTATATIPATGTGLQPLGDDGLYALAKDTQQITELTVAVRSSAAESAATVTVDLLGVQA